VGKLFGGEGDCEIAEEQVMSEQRIHLERVVGRKVVDSVGKKVGRLEEVIAGRDGLIHEYVLGKEGLLERLGVVGLSLIFLGRKKKGKQVPWEKMDLERLRLKCTVEELEKTEAQLGGEGGSRLRLRL
jgi:sporulation protein YlmC with PRC-barrel domain